MAVNRQALFLQYLHQALGTPYLRGGESRAGFDCSGLVAWAAQKAGIRGVPRTSEEQYQVGRPVNMNHLLPGDLVFAYPERGGPGHVVVYVGHGNVIAAPHTGTNVQVQPLSDFKGLIVGARRILSNPQGHVYQAGQFQGGGGSMQGDAAQGGQQGGMQQDKRAAALAYLSASQVHPNPLGQLKLPTAQGTIQNILQAHQPGQLQQQQTLQSLQPQLAAATATGGTQMPNYAGQLNQLHTQLLKTT